MSDIKIKHTGGDSAHMPSTGKGGHKVQKAAPAPKNTDSHMKWTASKK